MAEQRAISNAVGTDSESDIMGDSSRNEGGAPDEAGDFARAERGERRADQQAGAGAQTGRERVEVESGRVVIIDQFMLANRQFLDRVDNLEQGNADPAAQTLRDIAAMYGGCVLELASGTYEVFRDPEQSIIAMSLRAVAEQPAEDDDSADQREDSPQQAFDFQKILDSRHNLAPLHHVFIDTRCLAIIDARFFSDRENVDRYKSLRSGGRDKQARDMLRELGGAVRYGFNKYGDELGVFKICGENGDPDVIALWPDLSETA